MVPTTLAFGAVGLPPTRLYSASPTLPSYLETGVPDAFQISYYALSTPQDCYYVMRGTASTLLEFL